MLKKLFAKKNKQENTLILDELISQLNSDKMPKHVGIIMDGNGRWATGKGMIRTSGHKAGVKTLKSIVRMCLNINVPVLTVYAFSTENWKRPLTEVDFLMKLFSSFLAEQINEMCEDGIRVKFIGRIDELPGTLPKEFHAAEERTKHNTKLLFNVAVNYGGRDEILTAVQKIASQVKAGSLQIEDINEQVFEDNLYTKGVPPVDLMIRTSGDLRLSNFLLWQAAYAEFWFTHTNWPDFSQAEFVKAIIDFQHRDRRFGGLKNK